MRFFAGTLNDKGVTIDGQGHPTNDNIDQDSSGYIKLPQDVQLEDHIALTAQRSGIQAIIDKASHEARLLAKSGKERRAPYNSYLEDGPVDDMWKSLRIYRKKWDDLLFPQAARDSLKHTTPPEDHEELAM